MADSPLAGRPITEGIQMNEIVIAETCYETTTAINNQGEIMNRSHQSRRMEAKVYEAAIKGSIEGISKYVAEQTIGSNMSFVSVLLPLTPTGNSVLHLHLAAPFKERPASVEFIRFIIAREESLIWHKNDDGDTPLHLAADFGQTHAVQLLVQKVQQPRDLLLMTNNEGDTPLHMAVRNEHSQVVRQLLRLPLSDTDQVQVEYPANAAGETPLYIAAKSNSNELLDMVLNDTSTLHVSQRKETSLHAAVLWGDSDKVQLEYPAKAANVLSNTSTLNVIQRKETSLHAAVVWGNSEMVKTIMKRYPELIFAQDHRGQTPLHCAAGVDNDILKVLLALEYDSSAAAYTQDGEGRTAAHIATQHDNVDGLKLLMEYYPGCCEMPDLQGRNVVHYAAFLTCPGALKYFLRDVRFRYLVNKRDKAGNTPLHLLAASLKDMPYDRVMPVKRLIPELKRVLRLRVLNIEGLTAGDIADSHDYFALKPIYQRFVLSFLHVVKTSGRPNLWLTKLEDQNSNMKTTEIVHDAANFQKLARDHAVVAALIATVSFAAGLAVPGGFFQETTGKDEIEGTAILTRKAAFQAFVVADTVALTSSFTAILLYYLIAFDFLRRFTPQLNCWASMANCISMVALIAAFMTGTYSVLWQSKPLSISVIFIASAFVFISAVFFIYFMYNYVRPRWLKRRGLKDENVY